MSALVGPPTLLLVRKPFVAGFLPVSIIAEMVEMVEVSGLGEGERILRVEDRLKVNCENGNEVGDDVLCKIHCQWRMDDKKGGRWCGDEV